MSPITINQVDGGFVYVHSTTVVLESHPATPAPPAAMSTTTAPTATALPQVAPDVAGIQRVTGFIRRAADVLRARIHRATAA